MGQTLIKYTLTPRKPRILLIADGFLAPGNHILFSLLKAGYDIVHVGTPNPKKMDLCQMNLQAFPYRKKHNVFMNQEGITPIRKIRLSMILESVGDDFDAIVHVQDFTQIIETDRSYIPYFYYATEIVDPVIPRCAWVIWCGTHYIQARIENEYPTITTEYMPWAFFSEGYDPLWDLEKYPRTIISSFAGELYRIAPLYKSRQEIVKYLQKHITDKHFQAHYLSPPNRNGDRNPESGKGHLKLKDYQDLLLKSHLGLNIPTPGAFTFRDLEIPAFGGILLTQRTPDHDALGFEDGINCIMYDTPEEACAIIQSYNEFKPNYQSIRKLGWELIHYGRKWWYHPEIQCNVLPADQKITTFSWEEPASDTENAKLESREIVGQRVKIQFKFRNDSYPHKDKFMDALNRIKTNHQIIEIRQISIPLNQFPNEWIEILIPDRQLVGIVLQQLHFLYRDVSGHTFDHRITTILDSMHLYGKLPLLTELKEP